MADVDLTYFTDGSAIPNPGQGGFAVIKNGEPYLIGGEPTKGSKVLSSKTTNIRMEGWAIINAYRDAGDSSAEIYTDSEFWVKTMTEWAPSWAMSGWKKKGGEIKNLDIVSTMYHLYKSQPNVRLRWVRGHNGTEFNELADHWANIARKRRATDPVLVAEMDNATTSQPTVLKERDKNGFLALGNYSKR